jgi:hypothetical protein
VAYCSRTRSSASSSPSVAVEAPSSGAPPPSAPRTYDETTARRLPTAKNQTNVERGDPPLRNAKTAMRSPRAAPNWNGWSSTNAANPRSLSVSSEDVR